MPLIKIESCLNCEISHEWLFDGATLKELRMIKKLTGMNAKEFAGAGDDLDPEALAALVFVLHMRDKIRIPFEDVDLNFNDFTMEPTEDELKEIAKIEAEEKAAKEKANGTGEDPKEL
jgi:hypothetical protein